MKSLYISTIDASGLKIFRICFGIAFLLHQSIYWPIVTKIYSNQGYHTVDFIRSISPSHAWSLLFLPGFQDYPGLLYALLGLATVAFILGYFPRLCAFLMYVLIVSFQTRNPYYTYGADLVIRHVLFFSIFLPLAGNDKNNNPIFTNQWMLVCFRIQIALIYLFAGIPKLQSADWMNGSYIYSMLNYPNRSYIDFIWLQNFPLLVNLLTYFVLFFELSFAFLVWMPSVRRYVVLGMMMFHFGIFMTYNVVYFSPIMMSILPIMLSIEDRHQLSKWIHRLKSNLWANAH